MAKLITINTKGEVVRVVEFHRCGDCNDCPLNQGIFVMGCSNVRPCGQYHCWDSCYEHDCDSCPAVNFCKEAY